MDGTDIKKTAIHK